MVLKASGPLPERASLLTACSTSPAVPRCRPEHMNVRLFHVDVTDIKGLIRARLRVPRFLLRRIRPLDECRTIRPDLGPPPRIGRQRLRSYALHGGRAAPGREPSLVRTALRTHNLPRSTERRSRMHAATKKSAPGIGMGDRTKKDRTAYETMSGPCTRRVPHFGGRIGFGVFAVFRNQ